MSDQDDIDGLAAEYVLGTLDHAERAEVARRRLREPELEAAISAWERRLSPLLDVVEEQPPADTVFEAITAKLDGLKLPSEITPNKMAAIDTARRLEHRRAEFWRRTALSAMAAAAVLAIVAAYPLVSPQIIGTEKSFVAVFNPGDKEPAFVLSVDFDTRDVIVRRVGAKPIDEGSYQLWIVSKPDVPAPRPLGLLADGASPTRVRLPEFDVAVLRRATFGISREPRGGSPTGMPSPGALHGTLIPVRQD